MIHAYEEATRDDGQALFIDSINGEMIYNCNKPTTYQTY